MGEVATFLCTQLEIGQRTRRSNTQGINDYSKSDLLALLSPWTQAGTQCAYLTFFSKSTSMHVA